VATAELAVADVHGEVADRTVGPKAVVGAAVGAAVEAVVAGRAEHLAHAGRLIYDMVYG